MFFPLRSSSSSSNSPRPRPRHLRRRRRRHHLLSQLWPWRAPWLGPCPCPRRSVSKEQQQREQERRERQRQRELRPSSPPGLLLSSPVQARQRLRQELCVVYAASIIDGRERGRERVSARESERQRGIDSRSTPSNWRKTSTVFFGRFSSVGEHRRTHLPRLRRGSLRPP